MTQNDKFSNFITMTKSELKALVKQHFNLVEKSEKFDSATLQDGTKVTNDMDEKFAIGQMLFVIDEEGEKVSAPEGDHISESGIVFTVDAEGKIVDLKYPDMPAEGEEADMEVEEKMESKFQEEELPAEDEEKMQEEAPKLEDIIEVIGEVVEDKIEAMKKKMEAIEEEVKMMKDKMSAFASEPAEEKTVPTAKFSKQEKSYNEKRYNQMLEKLKN